MGQNGTSRTPSDDISRGEGEAIVSLRLRLAARRKGEPLLALVAMMVSWTAVRSALWQSSLPPPFEEKAQGVAPIALIAKTWLMGRMRPTISSEMAQALDDQRRWMALHPSVSNVPGMIASALTSDADVLPHAGVQAPIQRVSSSIVPPRKSESHDFTQAREVLSVLSTAPATRAHKQATSAPVQRWSGDAWMLLRQGAIVAASGAALPAYGASQAGAVLRYRLDPDSDHLLSLYVRGSRALVAFPDSAHEADAAIGLLGRPLSSVPIVLAVEERVSRFDNGSTHARPTVMAITQFPLLPMRMGWRSDLYVAGGYVGGAGASAFVDGQAHVDRTPPITAALSA